MSSARAVEQLHGSLARHSGYLRNPLQLAATCIDCAGPVDPKYDRCYKCNEYASFANTADLVGFMIYGIDGEQSGKLMYGYKDLRPGPSLRQIVEQLVLLGLHGHLGCARKLTGTQVTGWATVPSLRGRTGVHPLREIMLKRLKPGSEVMVEASNSVSSPRDFVPSNFVVKTPIKEQSHIVVVEDTWTGGGHAQSVAAALKAAGAFTVSILTVARWLSPTYQPALTKALLKDYVAPSVYDPRICPWTRSSCP